MVPFTPRLIPAILPNLAHHVAMIQSAATRTNSRLSTVIQNLPSPVEQQSRPTSDKPPSNPRSIHSPTPSTAPTLARPPPAPKDPAKDAPPDTESPTMPTVTLQRARTSTVDLTMTPRPHTSVDMLPPPPPPVPLPPPASNPTPSRPHSPVSFTSQTGQNGLLTQPPMEEADLFDYQATVNELTIQFLSEFEETRVAALKWLIMLHQKAPKKVGSFAVLC